MNILLTLTFDQLISLQYDGLVSPSDTSGNPMVWELMPKAKDWAAKHLSAIPRAEQLKFIKPESWVVELRFETDEDCTAFKLKWL